MQYKKRFHVKILLLLYLFSIAITSCSSGPPALQPWFNESITIETKELPPGVDFRVERDEAEKCLSFQDYIIVTNISRTPIFFEAVSYWGGSLDEIEEPCPGFNQCLKVVSNNAWQWDIINHTTGPPWDYDWILIDDYYYPETLVISKFGTGVGNSEYTIIRVELFNVFDYGDGRPEDVVPPPPREFELPFIYNDEELNITVTITYSINECYKKDRSIDPFENILECYVAFLVAFVALILLIVNTVVKGIERRAKERIQADVVDGN